MLVRGDQIVFQSGNYWLVNVGFVMDDFHVVYVLGAVEDGFGNLVEAETQDICVVGNPIHGQYIAYSMSVQYPEIN